jgi:hypothetical protein
MTKRKQRLSNLSMEQAREIPGIEAWKAYHICLCSPLSPVLFTTKPFFLATFSLWKMKEYSPLNHVGCFSIGRLVCQPETFTGYSPASVLARRMHVVARSLHQSKSFLFDFGNSAYMLLIVCYRLSMVLFLSCSKSQPSFG